MRKAGCRIGIDVNRIHSDPFADICRNGNPRAFVRKRKMSYDDLTLSMINRKGLTLTMELRGFMKIAHPGENISKPGYLKQRMKLNPYAFIDLYQFHNKNFYQDPETELYTYNGFLVLAVDGSGINIPTTSETLAVYGNASNGRSVPRAQLGLACLYDALNRMIIDASLHRHKFKEIAAAEEQIAVVRETIGDQIPFMVTMDRGYPSVPAFLRFIDSGTYFVARLKATDFKAEQQAMQSDDEDVTIGLTRNRRHNYYGTADEDIMNSRDQFNIRFVKVWLDEEHSAYEVLATNLPRDTFPAACFGELYHLRWRLETAYETLKDRLQLENFTGTKPTLIEQDIFSTIYVSNIAEDIAREIEQEQADHLKKDYKHRMAINRNVCIGILKSDLIYALLEKDPAKQDQIFQQIYDEISNNIVPVRPDRHYERSKGNFAGKYSNTHKRSY